MGEHSYATFEDSFLRHKSLWKVIEQPESAWWDDINTDKVTETQADIIKSSWNLMIETLEAKYGTDINKWQWKEVISLEHSHPLGAVKPLNFLFNVGPLEAPGGNETINNMIFNISHEEFKVNFGPSTRRIIDFGDIENSWGINPTGQSGVVMDKHYGDQAEMHSKGEFRRQYILKSDVIANKEGVLQLSPQ